MPFADPTRTENQIKDILNAATAGYGAAIDNLKYTAGAITAARIGSGVEVLRALAANPQNGYHGSLSTPITVTHNQFLPGHDGEPGIPLIVPFAGAAARAGVPAAPDEIDSYRDDATLALYTGALDGGTPHDQADPQGMPSAISCRYSIINGLIKFTGLSCQIPLIQLTREMANTGVPEVFEPTLIKLSIPKLVKEGDNVYLFAREYYAMGREDLQEIMRGAMKVRPAPPIVTAQKEVI